MENPTMKRHDPAADTSHIIFAATIMHEVHGAELRRLKGLDHHDMYFYSAA